MRLTWFSILNFFFQNQNLMASPECEDLNIYFLLGIIGKRKRDASTSPIPLPSGLESAVQKVLLFEGLFIFNGKGKKNKEVPAQYFLQFHFG